MQRDEWKKKLMGIYSIILAPGMNEAKQYDSLEAYHHRDDKKYKQRIEDTLKQVNVCNYLMQTEVKKIAVERMREEERKEHPR